MGSEENNNIKEEEVVSLGFELYFKVILFAVTILAFIAITATLIYMGLNKYESSTIIAMGTSDGILGLVIGQIARSLFRTNK